MAETAAPKRLKPHRVALYLSADDQALLNSIVNHEKDTVTNVIRRMIRSQHKRIFSPKPQALTLRLPQSSSDFSTFTATAHDETKGDPK